MKNFDRNINEIKIQYAKENPYAVQKENGYDGVIKDYIDTFVKTNGMSSELYKFIMKNPELGKAVGYKKEAKKKTSSNVMEPVDITGKVMGDVNNIDKYDRNGNKLQTKAEKDYDVSAQDALININNTKLEKDDANYKTMGEANKFVNSTGNDVVKETTKQLLIYFK